MSKHHEIDYIEFTVADLAESKRFYSSVFGWEFNDYGPDYCGIRKKDADGEVGGFSRGDPKPGGALVVLFSTDIEASRNAVVEAGGRVVKETFDFPGGRRFHFSDPSGNELAVWGK